QDRHCLLDFPGRRPLPMGIFTAKPAEPAPAPAAPASSQTLEQAFRTLAAQKTPGDNGELSNKLATLILERAVSEKASDIHFDPMGGSILVRFRIDGQLLDQLAF